MGRIVGLTDELIKERAEKSAPLKEAKPSEPKKEPAKKKTAKAD